MKITVAEDLGFVASDLGGMRCRGSEDNLKYRNEFIWNDQR